MAVLLLEGRANLPEFTQATVMRPDVQEMIKRINFTTHPDAEAAGYAKMTTFIDVHLRDGRTLSGMADFGKGSPENPSSYDEVGDKFRGCAEFARWPDRKTETIIDLVARLESLENLDELAAALVQ
jgi:2-methylcitrate dehydratase PrpD